MKTDVHGYARPPAASLPEVWPFLRAICESPEDDSPRLIFCDWLDEHGYDRQAEYVRLAIRLARAGLEDVRSPERDREWDLYDHDASGWAWPLMHTPEWVVKGWRFDRGFLREVTLDKKTFLDKAGALFALHPVTDVTFTGAVFTRKFGEVFLDAGLTSRGKKWLRVPGPIFPFLAQAGAPCSIEGAEARFDRHVDARQVVSRAAVNYGRAAAGRPPLAWPPPFSEAEYESEIEYEAGHADD